MTRLWIWIPALLIATGVFFAGAAPHAYALDQFPGQGAGYAGCMNHCKTYRPGTKSWRVCHEWCPKVWGPKARQ